MNTMTFLKRFSLVRLFMEAFCLIGFIMFLTAHYAYVHRVIVTWDHKEVNPPTDILQDGLVADVAWLLPYFMVPRIACGVCGIWHNNASLIAAHIAMTLVIFIMYFFVGFVAFLLETPLVIAASAILLAIELSSVIISWRLLRSAKGLREDESFDWRRLLREDDDEELINAA